MSWLSGLFKPQESQKPPKPEVPVPVESGEVIIAPLNSKEYEKKYRQARVLAQYLGKVNSVCGVILSNRKRYDSVQDATGVPWYVVACIHSLESGLDFKAVLHNGEKIVGTSKKTTLVPKGRGPFATWQEAAIDALGGPGSHFNKEGWEIGDWLAFLERYNGLGYRRKGLDSPYLWNFTSEQRTTGKYVADGKFDAKAVSKQVGAVAILKQLKV